MEDDGLVDHPDVAGDLYVPINSIFIVYRYIGNKSLKDLWDEKVPFSKRDIIQIGIELVKSVQNIHSTGYLHTDVKLDNIMISDQNRVILIDYGNAQRFKLADGSHRPDVRPLEFGNPLFASKNLFTGHTLSMRDDLI